MVNAIPATLRWFSMESWQGGGWSRPPCAPASSPAVAGSGRLRYPPAWGLCPQTPAVVLTGPRQTGKTSLLEHAFPDMAYVSLDAGSAAEAAL